LKFNTFFAASIFLITAALSTTYAQTESPPTMFKPPLSNRIANYDIAATLNTQTDQIGGKQILTWKNNGRKPASTLQFHLYMNAFRHSESTYMLESPNEVPEGDSALVWGYIDVHRLVLLSNGQNQPGWRIIKQMAERSAPIPGGKDLTDAIRFIQPDTPEHTRDQTVIEVALPSPVAPGDSIMLFFEFTTKLPEPPIARTGTYKEFYFAGQWFPKIGVWQDSVWNCHQFHANSEFFSDFGVYNVWLTLPTTFLVGATGVPVGTAKPVTDSTVQHYFHAEDVHDFAWTASPDFVEFKGIAQDVEIRALMQRDHISQGVRHIEATKAAIEFFQNNYGDYPYPLVTLVDPRRKADEVGGMEYPTLFTVGTRYGIPEGVRFPELVTIHEFGHNYWQGMVASNEFEESWLDEGINTYTEMVAMHEIYGEGEVLNYLGIKINDDHMFRASYLAGKDMDPILKKSWEYESRRSYAINSYNEPGLVLMSLHNLVGKDTMRRIISTYFNKWKFKHPTSSDFVDVVHEVTGPTYQPFLEQALYTERRLDYAVDRLYNRPTDEQRVTSTSDTTALPDSQANRYDSLSVYNSGFTVRRNGDFIFPVEIQVVFSDGDTLSEHWDGQGRYQKFTYRRTAKIVSATVDPQRKLLIDQNFTNNSQTLQSENLGVNKLAVRWLFWMQFLLDQPELFNLIRIFSR
jgi:hypothetical protein